GNVLAITPVWSIVAGGGAIGSGSGLFTAGTVPGTFTNTVQAASGGITGRATVIVTTGPLATSTVTPNPTTLAINGTQQFTAVARDAGGNVLALTPSWSVAAGGGTIGATTGLFTAGTVPGTYANTVVATIGGVSGTATVTVITGPLATITVSPNPTTLAINGTQQFTAVGTDAGGNVLTMSPVWSIVASGGAIGGSGMFTAGIVPGTFTNTVQASSGGITGRATVTVTTGPLATITVTPDPTTLAINGTQQFTAVGRDAGGNVVVFAPSWSVVAGGGIIDGAGLFTAGTTPGTFAGTVRVTSGAVTGSATVTVIAGTLATITVTPDPVTLPIFGTQQFTAVGTDASGNVVPLTPSWSLGAGGGAISAAGLFTAGTTPGTFTNTIVATSGSITGTATVTVTTGPLATIIVSPNPTTLTISGTQQFTAVGHDAGGNVVALAESWSIDAGGGTISAGGLFTAGTTPGTYTNTVVATSGAVTGSATVTVTVGSLATITVSPNPVTLAINGTQSFTAVGTDAGGNVVAITPTWSVAAGGGAISAGGLFTAGTTPGTYTNTVVATSGAVTGTATVTVTVGPLVTITVTPNPANLFTNDTQQFTAVGTDAAGNIVVITPTWSVVAGGGTISGTGLFTASFTPGTFTNTIQATSGSVSGYATVVLTASPPAGQSLGAAATHGVIAGSTITCVGTGTIGGDVSLSPGTAITGFPPCVIMGTKYTGTDAVAVAAQSDLTTAFTALSGLACTSTITADLGGTTLAPGVACAAAALGVTGTVTLDGNGDSRSIFVIKASSTLTTTGSVLLTNGAQARNVFWWVGTSATIGGGAWQGNILAATSITLNDNATIVGRALARGAAVTLGSGNTITLP
ncbi:MAG: ice-binding family protein, partial [Gemmatimonadaceae bacterium]|nr:ice-binding family protein [Gemmatimonadaceae bacterium]